MKFFKKNKSDQLLDNAKANSKIAAKAGGVGSFFKELQSLDVENYGNWSMPIRATTWSLIGVVVAGFGFTALSWSSLDLIKMEREDRTVLLKTYQEKMQKLKGAEQYKHQLVEIESSFNQQLQQLPKETEIPGLVDDLNRAGKQSGLKFEDLKLGVEIPKEFFIEQPIEIKAAGDFHSFGSFLESVASLPRIVAVKSFSIKENSPKDTLNTGMPKIEYTIHASTYRYLDNKDSKKVSDKDADGKASAKKEAVASSSAKEGEQ